MTIYMLKQAMSNCIQNSDAQSIQWEIKWFSIIYSRRNPHIHILQSCLEYSQATTSYLVWAEKEEQWGSWM